MWSLVTGDLSFLALVDASSSSATTNDAHVVVLILPHRLHGPRPALR